MTKDDVEDTSGEGEQECWVGEGGCLESSETESAYVPYEGTKFSNFIAQKQQRDLQSCSFKNTLPSIQQPHKNIPNPSLLHSRLAPYQLG